MEVAMPPLENKARWASILVIIRFLSPANPRQLLEVAEFAARVMAR